MAKAATAEAVCAWVGCWMDGLGAVKVDALARQLANGFGHVICHGWKEQADEHGKSTRRCSRAAGSSETSYQLIETALDECSLRGCGRISSPSAVVVLVSTRRFYPRCQMRHGGGESCLRPLAVLARIGPGTPPTALIVPLMPYPHPCRDTFHDTTPTKGVPLYYSPPQLHVVAEH